LISNYPVDSTWKIFLFVHLSSFYISQVCWDLTWIRPGTYFID
jgi:hypothetical protein